MRGHPALGLLSDPTVTLASRTQPLSRRPVLVHRLFLREQGPKSAKSQAQKLPKNPRPNQELIFSIIPLLIQSYQ